MLRKLIDPARARTLILLLLLWPSVVWSQRPGLSVRHGDKAVPLEQLNATLAWRAAGPGLEWAETRLRAGSWRLPIRAILLRIDARRFHIGLDFTTRENGMTGAWNVDSVSATADVALNAGQFKETGPWGWLVLRGAERRDPGYGPLSVGIAIDTAGRIRWVPHERLRASRHDPTVRWAFQSYPLLLLDGRPPALLFSSDDVDRDHRDTRLIFAELPSGELLLVMTRYDGFGGLTARVPIGPTIPESLALVQALGARHAVMLDGGLSAQLMLRDADAGVLKWNGLRDVPLGLVFRRHDR